MPHVTHALPHPTPPPAAVRDAPGSEVGFTYHHGRACQFVCLLYHTFICTLYIRNIIGEANTRTSPPPPLFSSATSAFGRIYFFLLSAWGLMDLFFLFVDIARSQQLFWKIVVRKLEKGVCWKEFGRHRWKRRRSGISRARVGAAWSESCCPPRYLVIFCGRGCLRAAEEKKDKK